MHIHTAYDVTMPHKSALLALPYLAFGLVLVPAYRTVNLLGQAKDEEIDKVHKRTLLIIASIAGLVLLIDFVLFSRHRASRSCNRSVDATITKIQGAAGSISSWWRVTAKWTDPQTERTLTFRSPHLSFLPTHHVGEQIAVNFDTTQPKHAHMEL